MAARYRKELWNFKTQKGIEKKVVCVLAGDNERGRMLAKANQMATKNNWKLL